MTNSSANIRPWYQIRWQILLIAIIAIPLSAYLRYQAVKPLEISVTSGPTGQDKTFKQRKAFLDYMEKAFHKKGWQASFDLAGEDGKTLIIHWERLYRPMVRLIVHDRDGINDLRDMGFKRLLFRNGNEEWDIDLKN